MKPLFNNMQLSNSSFLRSILGVTFLCASFLFAALEQAQAQGREDAPINLLQLGTPNSKPTEPSDNPQDSVEPKVAKTDNDSPTSSLEPAHDILTQPDGQEAQKPEPVIAELTSTRSDLPATSIGLRSVSKISLASVGLKKPATLSTDINALIWSESDAEQVYYLLNNVPALGSSAILNQLVFEIMSIAAVPPKGAGPLAEALVLSRLNWLADAGQSDALAEIVRMLPNEEVWAEWKRWQVEYDLIRQADARACRDAEKQAQNSLDDFWHQSRIICALLAGDKSTARFAADILQASGGEDTNFFQLVDKLLDRTQEVSLDLNTLDSVDLVLMDAAHEQISLAAFEQMPASMIQAASSFRYLAGDAALKTSFLMYERGLQEPSPTEQIWRALQTAPMPAEAALATLDGLDAKGWSANRHDELASAALWVSLALREEADTDILIQRAFQTELNSGRPEIMLALYASLIRQRLEADKTLQLSPEIIKDYALLLSLSAPSSGLPEQLQSAASYVSNLEGILAALKGGNWQAQSLDGLRAWALLPVLEAQNASPVEQDWASMLFEQTAEAGTGWQIGSQSGLVYHRLSGQHLFALQQLADQNKMAETALLASMLVQPIGLGWIDPQDSAKIITALHQVGLHEVADQFAEDVVKAHLIRRNFSAPL